MATKATHATDRQSVSKFERIINVGPATTDDFRRLGITSPQELIDRDPLELYRRICELDQAFHDPCVLDVFMATVDFMNGNAPQVWWSFTKERKKKYTNEVDQLRQKFVQ